MGTRVTVRRRLRAAQDVEQIADYLAADSLEVAIRFVQNTEATIHEISESPQLGGLFESGVPELAGLRYRRIMGFPNHLVFYLEDENAIDVIRVLHGARDLDTALRTT